jgi:hypothetical protein
VALSGCKKRVGTRIGSSKKLNKHQTSYGNFLQQNIKIQEAEKEGEDEKAKQARGGEILRVL